MSGNPCLRRGWRGYHRNVLRQRLEGWAVCVVFPALLWWRNLKQKANIETASAYCSFKR